MSDLYLRNQELLIIIVGTFIRGLTVYAPMKKILNFYTLFMVAPFTIYTLNQLCKLFLRL